MKGREAEYCESRAAQAFVWRLRSAGGERNKEEGDKRGSEGLALESLLELRTPEEDSGGGQRRRTPEEDTIGRSSHTVTSAHTTSDQGRGRDAGSTPAEVYEEGSGGHGEVLGGCERVESKWWKSEEPQPDLVTERSWQAGGASLGLLSAQGAGWPITDTTKLQKCHLPSRGRPTLLPRIMLRRSLRKDLHF